MRRAKRDERLQCQVEKLSYDFRDRVGILEFPKDNCCDMDGALNMFKNIDINVRLIETWSGNMADTVYRLGGHGWEALSPEFYRRLKIGTRTP